MLVRELKDQCLLDMNVPTILDSIRNNERMEALQSSVITWFTSYGRIFPWRQTDNPFHILIAEVLLRLTNASRIEQAYRYLVSNFGTPELMARASPQDLLNVIVPLGLHNRAQLLVQIASQLMTDSNGCVPRTFTELTRLKGVGRYTANAILCLGFERRVPLVDGNVSRVLRRCFGVDTDVAPYADRSLWALADKCLPKTGFREFNLGLIDLGALVCRYPRPLCFDCPVMELCGYSSVRGVL